MYACLFDFSLNAVYAYSGNSINSQLVMLDGPFISLNYNPETQMILTSTRPSTRHNHSRHILNQLAGPGEQNFCNNLHTFTRGNSCKIYLYFLLIVYFEVLIFFVLYVN